MSKEMRLIVLTVLFLCLLVGATVLLFMLG